MPTGLAQKAAEDVARQSYGRLLSFVATYAKDISAGEDALAGAFAKALETWPRDGVPDNPQSWLITVARRLIGNEWRHEKVKTLAEPTLQILTTASQMMEQDVFVDDRLKLMFVCAHPAISQRVHTALMLQTVLGLSADRIAACFMAKPTAISQQLVRAKNKIRDAGIAFEVPDENDLAGRLTPVLDAVYAAFGTGFNERSDGLIDEALFLGHLLTQLLQHEAEPHGLLALMLYSHSRRDARISASGAYVALADHDTELWDAEMISQAEQNLHTAASIGQPGRYQTEAAIQSVHASKAKTGHTNTLAIAKLYDVLWQQAPSLGCGVARAVAWHQTGDSALGEQLLTALPLAEVENYQPFWAARAHIFAALNQTNDAVIAYDKAIELSEKLSDRAAIKQFLADERQAIISINKH